MPAIFCEVLRPDPFQSNPGSIWTALETGSGYVGRSGTSVPRRVFTLLKLLLKSLKKERERAYFVQIGSSVKLSYFIADVRKWCCCLTVRLIPVVIRSHSCVMSSIRGYCTNWLQRVGKLYHLFPEAYVLFYMELSFPLTFEEKLSDFSWEVACTVVAVAPVQRYSQRGRGICLNLYHEVFTWNKPKIS